MSRFGSSPGRGSPRQKLGGRSSGRGNKSGRGFSKKTTHIEYKFSTHVGKGFATYATIKDILCQYIQKTYEYGSDIATALD